MENLPAYISIVFILTTFITVFIFYRAAHQSKIVLLLIAGWLLLQGFISRTGFYINTTFTPPRIALAIIPPLLLIVFLFVLTRGRQFIDGLNLETLTLLHTIRVLAELVLLQLSVHKMIPITMTFEGHNFDILSGLTAPLLYYFVFVKKATGYRYLLIWNIVCLLLLLNIVITALLSAPFPFQQLAFDQPNIAIFYFPFVWLPCCVVPVVLFSHLAAIRQIIRSKNDIEQN